MFSLVFFAIVNIPEFGALTFWIPMSGFASYREKPFFGIDFFFVPAGACQGSIYRKFFNRIQQGNLLQGIATGIVAGFFFCASRIDSILHVNHHQPCPGLFYHFIPEIECFREIMPCINMQQRKRKFSRPESLNHQVEHDQGIFSSGKQQYGV